MQVRKLLLAEDIEGNQLRGCQVSPFLFSCKGEYTFIGKAHGIGKEKKVTYREAWNTFERAFTKARIPCTKIDRYPVIARWRNDVDYVAAGIFCFQPYCVTGEL